MSRDSSRAAAALHASPAEASASSNSSTPVVITPPLESETFAANGSAHTQRRPSPLRTGAQSPRNQSGGRPGGPGPAVGASYDGALLSAGTVERQDQAFGRPIADEEGDEGEDEEEMAARPLYHRAMDGKSNTPLLKDENERGRPSYDSGSGSTRPPFHSRRSTFRSRSPDLEADNATRKKYTYAAFFLGLSLVSFVVQTETAVYIQQDLQWNKAYCMLWMTHGSWSFLWPVTFLILRIQKRSMPFGMFWKRHVHQLRTTAHMVRTQQLHLTAQDTASSPVWHMIKTTAFITCALTVAGGSWYVAVDLTTSSDLTAIYNCSAFFAYAFSIPLLGDKLRFDKIFSVGLAIIGVLIVAYGDTPDDPDVGGGVDGGKAPSNEAKNRLLGNIIIGIGSVLYGLYEVLYKKYACPPEGTSAGRGTLFAMMFGSCIGTFTVLVLWIPLPILHWTGIELFEWPPPNVAWLLAISTLSNATFSGSFLVLISLTSPVLSSVAALLTIFMVALVDWLLPGGKALSLAALMGGVLIIVAFLLLSWSTYRELQEERRKKMEEEGIPSDDDDD